MITTKEDNRPCKGCLADACDYVYCPIWDNLELLGVQG